MQTNRSNAGALIGGAVMIVLGLLSLTGQVFRNVDWGFLWPFTVIGTFVGVGIYIMGSYAGDATQKQSGARVIRVGVIMFIIFGTFFEMIFSSFNNMLFPILLIALGAYLVVTRSGLIGGKKNESSDSLPPIS
jgi:hypothetical protein